MYIWIAVLCLNIPILFRFGWFKKENHHALALLGIKLFSYLHSIEVLVCLTLLVTRQWQMDKAALAQDSSVHCWDVFLHFHSLRRWSIKQVKAWQQKHQVLHSRIALHEKSWQAFIFVELDWCAMCIHFSFVSQHSGWSVQGGSKQSKNIRKTR